MPREYKRIIQHEKELIEMKAQGLTHREIGEKLRYSKSQIKEFFCAYNEEQRKLAAGMALRKNGSLPKDYAVSEQDKAAELKYILARKDARIKSLKMENELMRDFLSITESKGGQALSIG